MAPSTPINEFARFAGDIAESFGFNRSLGQLYGLLYITPKPLSLEEIAKRLGMSKGNASINLRLLESWGAVQLVSVSGSRRDHYEADRDIKKIALRRVEEGVSRRLGMIHRRLDHLAGIAGNQNTQEARYLHERLKELHALSVAGEKALRWLPKAAAFFK